MCCFLCAQVTEQDIANIVAQWTGIPIEKVSADETERLIKMEEVLHGRVIGQVRRQSHGHGCMAVSTTITAASLVLNSNDLVGATCLSHGKLHNGCER